MTPDEPLPDFSDVEGGSSSAAAEPGAKAAPRTYEVKKGDSLSKIAKHVYGDASKWKAIFEANGDLLTNPDKIYPGQVLTIPDA
jgi:nucleoid-associated protein YgaU